MEQNNSNAGNVPPMPPMPPKKKKKKTWLWILLAIFVGIPVISAIVSPSDDKAKSNDKEESEKVEQDSVKSQKDPAKVKELKSKFTEKTDEFEGLTWIEPKSKPKYVNTTGIYSYFSVKDSVPQNMRLVIQYGADDWLFIKSYTFLIDGKTYEFSNPKIETDNNSTIWEWSDTNVYADAELNEIYARLINAKEAKIRFNGRQYNSDYTIPQSTLKSLRETRDYYLALGGE